MTPKSAAQAIQDALKAQAKRKERESLKEAYLEAAQSAGLSNQEAEWVWREKEQNEYWWVPPLAVIGSVGLFIAFCILFAPSR